MLAPTCWPCVIAAAAAVQARSSSTSSAREVAVTSNDAKCSRSWAGVTIPAWCSPWKVNRSMPGPGLAVGGPRGAHAAGEPRRPDGRAGARVAQQATPADSGGLLGLAHSVTAAVSRDSGSESALTASESCLTCGWDSWV